MVDMLDPRRRRRLGGRRALWWIGRPLKSGLKTFSFSCSTFGLSPPPRPTTTAMVSADAAAAAGHSDCLKPAHRDQKVGLVQINSCTYYIPLLLPTLDPMHALKPRGYLTLEYPNTDHILRVFFLPISCLIAHFHTRDDSSCSRW